MPDDVRLCDDFFTKSIEIWNSIGDKQKIALNLIKDSSRSKDGIPVPCWTGKTIKKHNNVWYTGWVDEFFICEKEMYKALIGLL